jgi:hypothetical protein
MGRIKVQNPKSLSFDSQQSSIGALTMSEFNIMNSKPWIAL